MLLKDGADTNARLFDGDDRTALLFAKSSAIVEALLMSALPPDGEACGAALSRAAYLGNSDALEALAPFTNSTHHDQALVSAATSGNWKAFSSLLKIGARIYHEEMLAVASTAFGGSLDILQMVLAHDDTKLRLDVIRKSLKGAVLGNHSAIVEYLLDSGAVDTDENLYLATEKRSLQIVKLFARHASTGQKNEALILAVHNVEIEMAASLLEHGADPNTRDVYGRTGIMISAWRGWDENRFALMIDTFLAFGADINARGTVPTGFGAHFYGESALTLSLCRDIALHSENVKVGAFLIQRGASLSLWVMLRAFKLLFLDRVLF